MMFPPISLKTGSCRQVKGYGSTIKKITGNIGRRFAANSTDQSVGRTLLVVDSGRRPSSAELFPNQIPLYKRRFPIRRGAVKLTQ